MERTILHCDLNNFFASVECRDDPSLRQFPVAVCGDETQRHGIVLAKNEKAKSFGVKTGEAIWQAKLKCPGLVTVGAHFEKYLEASRLARGIYDSYTDRVESFGIDECWLDVTGSVHLFGTGPVIADEIRARVKSEIGLTASVGVSFNKIFAKLGSDMKKPDGTTVITKDGFKQLVWPLPAGDLLFVGRATDGMLKRLGINTIGGIARCDPELLRQNLGKQGAVLWRYANGLDRAEVTACGYERDIKSVGNSVTTPRDVVTEEDARVVLWRLAEKVSERLRRYGFRCCVVTLHVRDCELQCFERQLRLALPACSAHELFAAAYELFYSNRREKPIRTLGIRASSLCRAEVRQLSIFPDERAVEKREVLDEKIDLVREKYGRYAVVRALAMTKRDLSGMGEQAESILHPFSYTSYTG